LRKMVRFALDAVTGFSYFPLQVMIYVSLILGILAVLAIPIISILRVILGTPFLGGQVTTIVLLLILSSFQLFFLFMMGQYVARIYDEGGGRPLDVVASRSNFEQPASSNAPDTDAPTAEAPKDDAQNSEANTRSVVPEPEAREGVT